MHIENNDHALKAGPPAETASGRTQIAKRLRIGGRFSAGCNSLFDPIHLSQPLRRTQVALNESVKKILRLLWVLVANGTIIWLIFTSIFGEPVNRTTMNREHWLEFLLKAALPAVAIALELVGSRYARWANVGYLIAFGVFYCSEAARYWSDSFHGVLLLIGLALLIIGGLTNLIYRVTGRRRVVASFQAG
jgi:hypothetical protein